MLFQGYHCEKILLVNCRKFGVVVNNWAAELQHDREGRELLGFVKGKPGTGEVRSNVFFSAQIWSGKDSGARTRAWDVRQDAGDGSWYKGAKIEKNKVQDNLKKARIWKPLANQPSTRKNVVLFIIPAWFPESSPVM